MSKRWGYFSKRRGKGTRIPQKGRVAVKISGSTRNWSMMNLSLGKKKDFNENQAVGE
jgi:hypothetical protein